MREKPLPLICVGGPSASGKTSFCEKLAAALKPAGINTLVLACDDYYRAGWQPVGRYGHDTPEAIDSRLLINELTAARRNELKQLRSYDMVSRSSSCRPIEKNYQLVLLEGAYGMQAVLQEHPSSLFIYMEVQWILRLFRRLKRDVRDRQRKPLEVIKQMLGPVRSGERDFISPLKPKASLVIRRERQQLSNVMLMIDSQMHSSSR